MVAPYLRDETPSSSDLICVCCSCRRERTAAEEWRDHTPVVGERLTHGICPACLYALYPDLAPLVHPRS